MEASVADPESDPHHFAILDPDSDRYQLFMSGRNLSNEKTWIRIQITKPESRIRIQIGTKLESWVRIGTKLVRIRNTARNIQLKFNPMSFCFTVLKTHGSGSGSGSAPT
jgi:hypothetical protein